MTDQETADSRQESGRTSGPPLPLGEGGGEGRIQGDGPQRKVRMATVWLDGCSGCHMSFLDLDERLIEIAQRVEMVYTPLIDAKAFPDDVDVALVEGAVSSEEDLEKIHRIRRQTRILVAFGDCAVTANVPSMRNAFPLHAVYQRGYVETATQRPGVPTEVVPRLLPTVRPIHEYVPVDVFLQGCPPPADVIYGLLTDLVDGRAPDLTAQTRFGR
jgi:NAD-reducing hydrogenase small subunit